MLQFGFAAVQCKICRHCFF